jgi:hypothetical protein
MRHYTSVKQWERGRRKVNYTDEEIEALRPIVRRFFGRRSPAEDYDFFWETVGHRRQSVWYDAAEMLILLCNDVSAARLKKIGVARFVADYRAGKID